MKLITDRLIIREFEKKDIHELVDNINNLEVSKNLLVVPYPYTKKVAMQWISKCKVNAKKTLRKDYDFAIELKSGKKLIGGIALKDVDQFQGMAEIGFWLGEKYWRQGLMSEAIDAVLKFAFEKLSLRRINWYAFTDNQASNVLASKTGFVFEGTYRQGAKCKADNKIHDSNIYGLLREDWKEVK